MSRLRSSREGMTGTGNRHYPPDPWLYRGALADDKQEVVYPEDRCEECEKLGRLSADEKCFHRHWKEQGEAK